MKKLLLLAFFLLPAAFLSAQTAMVQIIHNSPDPAAQTVDIYLNAGATPAIDDFAFRKATPFISLPANTPLNVGVAPGTSTGPGDIIATIPLPALTAGEKYVVIATGVLDPFQFDGTANGTAIGFDLEIITPALTADPGNQVSLNVFHGAPDAPAVDVLANNGLTPLIPGLAYRQSTGYVSLPPATYYLSVTPAGLNNVVVGTFQASLDGLGGGAGVVFASGFLNPSLNQSGAAFGLFAALADGTVVELPAVNCNLGIIDFTLIDAKADTVITAYDPIPDGAVIDLAAVGTDRLNIRANTCDGFPVGSISFDLTGSQSKSKYDNNAPFSLFGDNNNGGYFIWPSPRPVSGDSYTVTATAYQGKVKKGSSGTPVSVNFSFVDSNIPAFVQIIHNSADPGAETVDIYLDGGAQPAVNDFKFRTATPFLGLPSGKAFTVGIAPGNSTGPNDIIASFPFPALTANESYVVMATGVLDPTQFDQSVNSAIGFTLEVFPAALQASGNSDVAVLAYHGSTDAPAVDVLANGLTPPLIPAISYGDFAGYLNVAPGDYTLTITPAGQNATVVAEYRADLTGLGGGAAVVFASGVLDPTVNQNAALFGLFAALPDGTVIEFPAPGAYVQIIHNSPDPAAAVVDIYINGGALPAIDDLGFREATPFLTLPSGVPLTVGIAPGNSTGPGDIIASFPLPALTLFQNYVVMATGVLDPSQFDQSVNGASIGFTLNIQTPAQQDAAAGQTAILAYHGSPDAPAVDVLAFGSTPPLVPNLSYGDFAGYLSVPSATYVLDVTPAGQNSTVVASYQAMLDGLGGQATVVFASGFLNPANNQSGAAFGLFATLNDGTVIPLPTFECDLGVLNFTLIDGKTDLPIPGYDPIMDGAVIDLAGLNPSKLNIRANICPGNALNSVAFELTGSQTLNTVDNNAPFALFKDNGKGGFFQWTGAGPAAGDAYTLMATGYDGKAGNGVAGTPKTISFSFIQSPARLAGLSELTLTVYPNPTMGKVQLEIEGANGSEVEVVVRNLMGQIVNSPVFTTASNLKLDLSGQPSGVYFIQVSDGNTSTMQKVLVQ
ncbi:MAG: DUF4397 domain-containing protein [Bacteroidia bacterium]